MELANALYYFILVMHIALMAIVVYLVSSWIRDAYHEKRCERYAKMAMEAMPQIRKEFTEMSIDTITRINNQVFKQYCQEEEEP